MKTLTLLFVTFGVCVSVYTSAQTNIMVSNPVAEQIMLGNYNPATYQASTVISDHAAIAQGINNNVSRDSLKALLEKLVTFENRNTGSDTVSNTRGIGAARRWVISKFDEYSAANENRLVVSYLQWDQTICSMNKHRNMMAILPGSDTSDKSIIIIQGHIDSRCAGSCDITCIAHGAEDNGSGTVLTMELARVMAKYTFKNTIVFSPLIGEEQGLYGGHAFAQYCVNKGIKVKAVLNNDISGGILCGYTASGSGDSKYPACSGFGSIDSMTYRIFSLGGFNSPHKQFARFVKLQYKEELLPYVTVPTMINILASQDRTGRGGDHIPFNDRSMTAVRFTAANENGNASNAADRQHTVRDVLGDDLNSDGILDTFYVDFNYLKRNSCVNGIGAAMAAIGPRTPDFTPTNAGYFVGGYNIGIQITTQTGYPQYRVAIRTNSNDWDSVFTITGKITDTLVVPIAANAYYISVASVDADGVESLFSGEKTMTVTGINENSPSAGLLLLPNHPNPFDEATYITIILDKPLQHKQALLRITDLSGKLVKKIPLHLKEGVNEVLYVHGHGAAGTYMCSLVIDGKTVQSQKMVFNK